MTAPYEWGDVVFSLPDGTALRPARVTFAAESTSPPPAAPAKDRPMGTAGEAIAAVSALDVSRFPMPLTLIPDVDRIRAQSHELLLVWVQLVTRDRERDAPTELRGAIIVQRGWTAVDLVMEVRKTLRALLEHELDEHLMVNGHRAFDPHDTSALSEREKVRDALSERATAAKSYDLSFEISLSTDVAAAIVDALRDVAHKAATATPEHRRIPPRETRVAPQRGLTTVDRRGEARRNRPGGARR